MQSTSDFDKLKLFVLHYYMYDVGSQKSLASNRLSDSVDKLAGLSRNQIEAVSKIVKEVYDVGMHKAHIHSQIIKDGMTDQQIDDFPSITLKGELVRIFVSTIEKYGYDLNKYIGVLDGVLSHLFSRDARNISRRVIKNKYKHKVLVYEVKDNINAILFHQMKYFIEGYKYCTHSAEYSKKG